jgi:hypothetical protein
MSGPTIRISVFLAFLLAVISQGCVSSATLDKTTPASSKVQVKPSKNIDQDEWYKKHSSPDLMHRSVNDDQSTRPRGTLGSSSPWFGYGDAYSDDTDQDCEDIGRMVYVGNYDPDGLDADGDGWGCEGWYAGIYLPDYSSSNSYDYEDDSDCEDVGEEVWVGSYDPDGLDADGDGWGCEGW